MDEKTLVSACLILLGVSLLLTHFLIRAFLRGAEKSDRVEFLEGRCEDYHALQETIRKRNSDLEKQVARCHKMIRVLRDRQDSASLTLTWLKTPDTDERVCKVRVREQLAIELENTKALKYTVREWNDNKLGGPQISVTASINLLKLKDYGTE